MTLHTVTLSDSELAIVTAALGYAPTGKLVKPRVITSKTFSHGKPPRLGDKAHVSTARGWETLVVRAQDQPGAWGNAMLVDVLRRPLGYNNAEQIERAWGISLPERA